MKEAMAGITDPEIVALASHYAALPSVPASVPVQAQKYRSGEETARKTLCGTCHLGDYTGQNQVPRLAGQNEDYLLQSMKQFRDSPGPGRDTIMAAALYGLSDADLGNMADFLWLRPALRALTSLREVSLRRKKSAISLRLARQSRARPCGSSHFSSQSSSR